MPRLRGQILATVDGQGRAGDEARFVGHQIGHGVRDFLGLAQTAHRDIADFLVRRAVPTQATRDRYTPSRIRHIILHGCFTEDHWTLDSTLRPAERAYSYNLMVIVSAHLCDILPSLKCGAAAFMLNLAAAEAYEALMVVHILKYPRCDAGL